MHIHCHLQCFLVECIHCSHLATWHNIIEFMHVYQALLLYIDVCLSFKILTFRSPGRLVFEFNRLQYTLAAPEVFVAFAQILKRNGGDCRTFEFSAVANETAGPFPAVSVMGDLSCRPRHLVLAVSSKIKLCAIHAYSLQCFSWNATS